MVYFLSYGDIKFPRFFYTDVAKAKQHKVYYESQGYSCTLRKTNNPDRILSVANRWVETWGQSGNESIREQREAQAARLHVLADNAELTAAISCPSVARYAENPTHAAYSSVHMFS